MFPIQEINVTELRDKFAQNEDFDLVDIRTPAEIARGVLPNAKALPMHLIPLKMEYFVNSGKPIILYCRTGSRSAQACMFLNQHGIQNIFNLRGGIVSWAQNGYQIEAEPIGTII
jgi:rhodanese-related sulfurtransferase